MALDGGESALLAHAAINDYDIPSHRSGSRISSS